MKRTKNPLRMYITLRVAETDIARAGNLAALMSKRLPHGAGTTRSAVLRAALSKGLDSLEREEERKR